MQAVYHVHNMVQFRSLFLHRQTFLPMAHTNDQPGKLLLIEMKNPIVMEDGAVACVCQDNIEKGTSFRNAHIEIESLTLQYSQLVSYCGVSAVVFVPLLLATVMHEPHVPSEVMKDSHILILPLRCDIVGVR